MSSVASGWAAAMWTACWQGGLVILAVWLLCRLLPKMNSSLRQALWWLACLKLVVCVVWVAPVSLSVLPSPAAPIHATLSKLAPVQPSIGEQAASRPDSKSFPWAEAVLAAWVVGLLVTGRAAVRSGLSMHGIVTRSLDASDSELGDEMRRLAVTMGLAAPPRLLISGEVTSPLVVGHRKPSILIPAGFEAALTSDERRMALAHELAHVRRGDLWLAVVPSAAYVLFYFFPPVWLACREWAADREAACDMEAIAATGAAPKVYGQLLMKIVAGDHRRAIAGLGATANFNSLKMRIARMKLGTPSRQGRWLGRAALGAGSLFIVPWSLTAPLSGGGLLANPGMESGKFQPSAWLKVGKAENVQQVWDREVSHAGKGSLCIARSDDRFWPITSWVQSVRYDGHSRYIEFGAWIKADHARKAVLDVQFFNQELAGSHEWAAYIGEEKTGDPPANHDWKWYSGVVEIPKGTSEIRLALQNYGGGTVWMDDATARYVSRPAAGNGGTR